MLGLVGAFSRLAWLSVVGCGRIAFDPRGDMGGPTDGALGAWGPATPLAIPNLPATADDPTMTADELELYFNTGTNPMTIVVSTRTDRTAPWTTAVDIGLGYTFSPHISSDGLSLWASCGGDVCVATRASRAAAWSALVVIAELTSPGYDDGPSVTGDELTMVFDSERVGGVGDKDIWTTTRPDRASPWGPPVLIGDVVSTVDPELRPHLSDDRRRLYYQAFGPAGNFDLWLAERPDPSAPFATRRPLSELSTAGYDEDPWESTDGHHLLWGVDEVLMEAWR
jgi:hypothetical protein